MKRLCNPDRVKVRHWPTKRFLCYRAVVLLCLAGVLTPITTTPGSARARGSADTDPSGAPPTPTTASPSVSRAAPLTDPVVDADAHFGADQAVSWADGRNRMLLLNRGVSVKIGSYGFRAQRAVIRIDQQQHPGQMVVRHLWIYLDQAQPLQGLGPVDAQAPRLLVTASTTGRIHLATDLLEPQNTAVDDPLVTDALDRFNRHQATVTKKLLDLPTGKRPQDEQAQALRQHRRHQIAQDALRKNRADHLAHSLAQPTTPPAAPRPARPIMPTGGTVSFHAEKIIFEQNTDPKNESTLALLGNVRLIYQNTPHQQSMSLRAENAVIFLAPEAIHRASSHSTDAGDVRGVYLEDNVVATNGQYTVRSPRVFYDLTNNRAIVLDAVFYTWDVRHNVPIYVRARKLRQESMTHWSAGEAALTTSEFAEPHFSIASGQLEFRRQTNTDGSSGYRFVAQDNTMRWGRLPVFYWPYLAGDAGMLNESVLPRVSASYSNQDGPIVRTTWNLFAVAGQPEPDGVKLQGHADFLGDRGPAVGVSLDYSLPQMFGSLDGYVVVNDNGDDELDDDRDISFDGDTRGYGLWRHRQYLPDGWALSLEVTHVSDETFLEEFFRQEAEVSKPYETSLYLKKQEDDRAFTFLFQQLTTSFTPQTTTLQAPGYDVEKTPQFTHHRQGVSLWEDRLTYTSETSFSRVRIQAGQDSPSTRGFNATQSAQLFGISPATTFESANRAAGIPSSYRLRLDSRHEIQSPLKMGAIDLVPYAAGRVTAYDDDFESFRGEDDRMRLWTTLGLRTHTQFSKTYEQVNDPVLDLYRLRHVVEPRFDLFWSGSTIDPEDIPVYDTDVEGLHEGLGVRVGARNIFQTQRGGTGRWRSIDWLVVGTDLVLRSDDTDVDQDVARFFSYRPELSPGGDHFHTDLLWMVTDALATVGELTYSLEHSTTSKWRLGLSLQHTPRLSFFADYAEIDPLSSRLFTYGFNYEVTPKYSVSYTHTLDLGGDESRNIMLALERKLPRWTLQIVAQIDDLEDETTFGLVLVPAGLRSSRLVRTKP